MRLMSCLLALLLVTGCQTTSSTERYPWEGPLLGPDGWPPPVPAYDMETNTMARAHR